ncbi:hypothetical protein AAFF_G00436700 [Aldrovandia affinis]|uniref:Uncharacterized protein n=1 Tax=Aldrovandia affinis TaxID=143900 RepID=A0AAD7SAA7_9TELE|nr:hypothetical protein AAFF_G00436700 [Aldrovandia affinis]
MLGQNQISAIKPEIFTGMKNLSDLELPLNSIMSLLPNGSRPLIALKSCQAPGLLEMLVLDNNHLNMVSSSMLEGLSNLQELYVRNIEIEELPMDMYKHIPKLTLVALRGNWMKTIDGNLLTHLAQKKCTCIAIPGQVSLVRWISQTKANLSPQEAVRCLTTTKYRDKPLNTVKINSLVRRA